MSVSQEEIDRFTKDQLQQARLVSRTDLQDLHRAMDNLHAIRSRLAQLDADDDLSISVRKGKLEERLISLTVADLDWLVDSIDKLTSRFAED